MSEAYDEAYGGVKYLTRRVEKTARADPKKAGEMIRWGRILYNLRLAPPYEGGSCGNLGFRDGNEIYVTPSHSSLGGLKTGDIVGLENVKEENEKVTVYFYGHPESGSGVSREPTSEAHIYWEVFKARPDVEVIMHGHDPYILKNARELLKRPGVVITERSAEYGTRAFKDEVMKVLKEDTDFIIAKDHGFFSLGKTFEEAGYRALKFHVESRSCVEL